MTNNRKLRIGIIGCGQISEAHLKEISFIDGAEVVSVCDIIDLLAEDIAERFKVKTVFTDYKKMIREVQPDIIHVVTPPHTHFPISSYALEKGCHVYIEKPFGLNQEEARRIIETAKKHERIACAGFTQLFDLVSLKVRRLIRSGYVGEIVHVETYYGDSLEGDFSKLFLQNKEHWIHKLPGKLFQNVISHALYHIVPFFSDEVQDIFCLTQDLSGKGVFEDELRVIMRAGKVTGFLTYTNAARPVNQFFRLYGTKSIIHADLSNHIVMSLDCTLLPGPVARIRNALIPAKSLFRQGLSNAMRFVTGRDRFFAGMGNLFNKFYQIVRVGSIDPPVPYEYVLKHSAIMDEIAFQCKVGK